MKEPIKISLQAAWLDAFFTFLQDYIKGCTWGQFFHKDILFAAYRGWKNTMFGNRDDDEPSIQVKKFCKIIDSMCLPYLNGVYIMFRMGILDMATIVRFTEMMIDKINGPCFNVKDVIPQK